MFSSWDFSLSCGSFINLQQELWWISSAISTIDAFKHLWSTVLIELKFRGPDGQNLGTGVVGGDRNLRPPVLSIFHLEVWKTEVGENQKWCKNEGGLPQFSMEKVCWHVWVGRVGDKFLHASVNRWSPLHSNVGNREVASNYLDSGFWSWRRSACRQRCRVLSNNNTQFQLRFAVYWSHVAFPVSLLFDLYRPQLFH